MDITIVICFTIALIMFPLSGIDKIVKWPMASKRLQKHISWISSGVSDVLVTCAVILQLIAPVLIMYTIISGKSKLIGILAALSLAVFTILATIVFYIPATGNKYYALLGNLTTLGCMLLISYEINKQ
jgi:drug/metabolite transporter superfamily protein YnfA